MQCNPNDVYFTFFNILYFIDINDYYFLGSMISTPLKDMPIYPMTIPSVSPILGRQEDSERFVDTDVSLNQRYFNSHI